MTLEARLEVNTAIFESLIVTMSLRFEDAKVLAQDFRTSSEAANNHIFDQSHSHLKYLLRLVPRDKKREY